MKIVSMSGHLQVSYLIVVVQQTQSGRAVLVSVDAHHGFGGRRERVLQEGLPGLIFARVRPPLAVSRIIL